MKNWIWKSLCALLFLAVAGLCAMQVEYNFRYYEQPKFRSLTIELGQPLPEFSGFYTEHAKAKLTRQISPLEAVDVSRTGTHELTFAHGSKVETVTLTVQDTVAPTAVFHDINAITGQELHPEDFVSESYDLSGTTVSFAEGSAEPSSYGNASVDVVVTDGNGNAIRQTCRVYYVWMNMEFSMELGDTVTKEDLLIDPVKDAALLNQADLDAVNASPVGTYVITSTDGDQSCSCAVTVVDTTPPVLELREVSFFLGGTAALEDFVVSATDLSGEVSLALKTELDFEHPGVTTVVVEATDVNGNVTTGETTLTVKADTTPPVFYGLWSMTVEKHSSPDFTYGVSAYDTLDGYVDFTVDASGVDTSKRGTYYVYYSAVDSSGNRAVSYRTVTVSHDAADTAALVSEVASGLSSDPLEIRNYVRNLIYYSYYNWGGSDPVWYGLQIQEGNCYVFAEVLKILLEEKGYTCQLIWVTEDYNPHYWVLIYLDGGWKHIDATPGPNHMIYDLMNDDQRLETLSGRTWDRDSWPAAE